jgi:hypothetical protein
MAVLFHKRVRLFDNLINFWLVVLNLSLLSGKKIERVILH